ncbi:MAG: hypothetical protein WBW33_19660 [Bryobacteraceae bacterium]
MPFLICRIALVCVLWGTASPYLWSQATLGGSTGPAFSLTELKPVPIPPGTKLFQFGANVNWRSVLAPCSPAQFNLAANCVSDVRQTPVQNAPKIEPLIGNAVAKAEVPKQHFQWGPALFQSFEFLVLEHTFRFATDPGVQYDLYHKPFWYDYRASADHYNMNRWGDGDSFLVNYIGHPLQGAVSGNIYRQNDPRGRSVRFGRDPVYWETLLKALVWSTAYSTFFEYGPILSETALGNQGGYTYVPGCGLYPCQGVPGQHYKPPTNNTGWVDFIVTPLVGTGWMLLEDAIEREFTDRVAKGSDAWKYRWIRYCLSPSHTLANVLAFHAPWYRYPQADEASLTAMNSAYVQSRSVRPAWKGEPRYYTGLQFSTMSLPQDRENCNSCRSFMNGVGYDFGYRFAKYAYLDTQMNWFPGSGSTGQNGSVVEGLFGVKAGYRWHSWGLFAQVRPGFMYYSKALVTGSENDYASTTRFAGDVGGAIEYYAAKHSMLQLSVGTTLIHYLTDHPDPNQRPTTVLSDQYYYLQGNFHIALGYQFGI